jgi:hypothetical protein
MNSFQNDAAECAAANPAIALRSQSHALAGRVADSLGHDKRMRAHAAFLMSVVLVLVALSLRLGALGQFQEGYRIRAQKGQREVPAEHSRRGALFLYASLPLAIAAVISVFISYRRREPAWRWVPVGLLGLYVLVSFAPA